MASFLSIDARSAKDIQAVILALDIAHNDVAKTVRRYSQSIIAPEFKKAVTEHATTPQEFRVIAGTAGAQVSDRGVVLRAAMGAKKLSGGLVYDEARGIEFGGHQARTQNYKSRRGSKTFQVKGRHTQRQFRPINSEGYVFYPAARVMIPRVRSLWVQTVLRMFRDAFEERS